MKRLFTLLIFIGFCHSTIFPQVDEVENYQGNEPKKIMMNTHDPNLKSFPEKSFYKQKEDWQYIIDTTWGAGLPLAQKQQIFNTYIANLETKFDGFQSLGLDWASWGSLKNFYYSQIDANTSRGRFCAIMQYLCSKLRDAHTYCDDNGVFTTPLNPGVPFFIFSGMVNTKHFGAVTTVLSDSSVLILRVVDNHPLNLEPGDIILGYEGVPWKDLIVELMEAELPNYDFWGGYDGTFNDHLFIGAGMNWHLFDTMDVLKYSTGDTVHLSVAPMVNLNVPSVPNNEQMEIPNIPFPNYFNGEIVTSGILSNTNIGYIYVFSEYPSAPAEEQFYQAVISLQNTDALIIDMRWNEGGWAFWHSAFNILVNETIYTTEYSIRCNPTTFDLCPINLKETFKIPGTGPGKYAGPIAVLVGPNSVSNGDINAYRLKYLYNVRTFGKPTWASLGLNEYPSIPGWTARLSTHDMFHLNNPGNYLNRKEFPVDFPVWHNRDDVAMGKDAVVEKALDWINNLVYPHNTMTDRGYYSPVADTVQLSTTIENPNSNQLSARAYLKTLENVLIDSVDLSKQTLKSEGELWAAEFNLPPTEEFYKISITSFDQTASTSFTVPNAIRFTTAGPLKMDSVAYVKISSVQYGVKPYVKNYGTSMTISGAKIKLYCDDPWVTSVGATQNSFPPIAPGVTVLASSWTAVNYDTASFPGYFNIRAEITRDGWSLWANTTQIIVTGVDDELPVPLSYSLEQNYPNPFNPMTVISYQLPVGGDVLLKVYDILGNEVVTLVDVYKSAGKYETDFNAASLPSGVYFYQLKAGEFIDTEKMILLK